MCQRFIILILRFNNKLKDYPIKRISTSKEKTNTFKTWNEANTLSNPKISDSKCSQRDAYLVIIIVAEKQYTLRITDLSHLRGVAV